MVKKKRPLTTTPRNRETNAAYVEENLGHNPNSIAPVEESRAEADALASIEEGTKKLDLIYRGIRYLFLYLYIILVYGGLLLTDYIILTLVAWLLHDEISKHHIVAMLFDYLRVGLALVIMFGAAIHGFISLKTLIKLDLALSRVLEDNEKQ